jgi:hypothetical protein
LTKWREAFAAHALAVWNRGGDVWITRRAWADRPNPSWGWTEGDDPRIAWSQIPAFMRELTIAESTAGSDGFAKLADTPQNRAFLRFIANPH